MGMTPRRAFASAAPMNQRVHSERTWGYTPAAPEELVAAGRAATQQQRSEQFRGDKPYHPGRKTFAQRLETNDFKHAPQMTRPESDATGVLIAILFEALRPVFQRMASDRQGIPNRGKTIAEFRKNGLHLTCYFAVKKLVGEHVPEREWLTPDACAAGLQAMLSEIRYGGGRSQTRLNGFPQLSIEEVSRIIQQCVLAHTVVMYMDKQAA
jgi:hypothetical protein